LVVDVAQLNSAAIIQWRRVISTCVKAGGTHCKRSV